MQTKRRGSARFSQDRGEEKRRTTDSFFGRQSAGERSAPQKKKVWVLKRNARVERVGRQKKKKKKKKRQKTQKKTNKKKTKG